MAGQRIRIPEDVFRALEAKAAASGQDIQAYLRGLAGLGGPAPEPSPRPSAGAEVLGRIEELERRVGALEAGAKGPTTGDEDFDDLDEIL